jgi:cytochrome P450
MVHCFKQGPDAGKVPFMGFGNGPRICPGADLARLEVAVFLHHFVTKFTYVFVTLYQTVLKQLLNIHQNSRLNYSIRI